MTSQGRADAVAGELELAEDERVVAEAALSAGRTRNALARVYFSAFHLVRALLYSVDHEPRTHAGVQHLFNRHFVARGLAPPRFNALLTRLQRYREQADYATSFPVDEAWVREELDAVAELRDFVQQRVAGLPE